MKPLYGLIGYPLGHSFSAGYFSDKFIRENIDAEYRNWPMEDISELPALVESNKNLKGFNVTIPYKEKVLDYLDSISPEASHVGAVNCVRVENGRLTGYNTDIFGFRESLLKLIGTVRPAALVLGTGGASKAAKYVLEELGINYALVSRTPDLGNYAYNDLNESIIGSHKLIINTTPLGTFPDINACPDIPYGYLTPQHYLFDMIYNPSETLFLTKGKAQGARIVNGMEMLIGQAEKAWEIWNL